MISKKMAERMAAMVKQGINSSKEAAPKRGLASQLAAEKVIGALKGNAMKKGGMVKKSSDTMGRAVKRKTADVKGRAMKKGK